jgi:hypothetical protein
MGLCGTVHIWILGFYELAKPITQLWRKDASFTWGEKQDIAFETLKEYRCLAPAMRSIDYTSSNSIHLSVDSSFIAVGIILSQVDNEGQ